MKMNPVYGHGTGVRLDQAGALFLRDQQHPERPLLTRQAIQLSAEMVSSTYSLSMEDWQQAGWQDVHVEIDRLMTRPMQGDDGTPDMLENLQMKLARNLLESKGPLHTITGVIRQTGEVDTCKAMVMAKTVGKKAVIAISFMGTSKRIFDWVSNLRMQAEDGMHQGFLQLTRQFESYEKEITFPETAKDLGLDHLTLSDVLEACRAPGSPFILWMVGHSQGGAIAQIYMDHKMKSGVCREYIAAFGFASPSVKTGEEPQEDYPMFHILNSDDVVPRMGAIWHLGRLLVYPACADMRRACYEWPMDTQSISDRRLVRGITSQMTDTGHDMIVGMAYCRLLAEEPYDTLREGLRSLGHALPDIPDALTDGLENTVRRAVDRLMDRAAEAYETIYGQGPDLEMVIDMMKQIRSMTNTIGMMRFAKAFGDLCMEPHRVQLNEHEKDVAYLYIARQDYQKLYSPRKRKDSTDDN